MTLDYTALEYLRQNHAAWRLLCAGHAPLVIGFVVRVFIEPNVRWVQQSELVAALDDDLFLLRERQGPDAFPRASLDYLSEWSANDTAWLRRYYPTGSDEPHYEPTAATEKAISWLSSLTEREFVGTESRLLTLFELLRQISSGTETDAQKRLEELQQRRDEIDAEIERVRGGELSLLNEAAVKDRFQQFLQLSRELLSDFREVEGNFRELDRRVRERIALWDGSKAELLDQIQGERHDINESEQGHSFSAFWDFLMSPQRQEELERNLESVLQLPAVQACQPDSRLCRIHYDWEEAGRHILGTIRQLSQQIRRFLDDRSLLENRRILEILRGIETRAIAVRDNPPKKAFAWLDDTSPTIDLPMERPLFQPPVKPVFSQEQLVEGDSDADTASLFSQVYVDKEELRETIRQTVRQKPGITLQELVEQHPLRYGLAELLVYLHLAHEMKHTLIDEGAMDAIVWQSGGHTRSASLPRVIFGEKNT